MSEGIVVVRYDAGRPELFDAVGARLRQQLAEVAIRIDHIGSTAVVGLDAKPIIDIQIAVASFDPLEAFKVPIERAGFVHRADNSGTHQALLPRAA